MRLPMEARSEPAALLGWWQLVSCEVELRASGQRRPMYDAPARGYIVFAPDGRMMTVVEVLHRRSNDNMPASRGMAYTGRYQVTGDQWLTQVDAASNVE